MFTDFFLPKPANLGTLAAITAPLWTIGPSPPQGIPADMAKLIPKDLTNRTLSPKILLINTPFK